MTALNIQPDALIIPMTALNNQPDALIIPMTALNNQPDALIIPMTALNNQPDALITPMTASKQSQDGTALQFHPDSAWKQSSNLHETYQRQIYSRNLLMMGREDARNM
jgi:hypothetical protein